ncbi:PorP/SprF family type IX secretion system membrane protein [Maribacter ulvicola]|uniref:Type IX secretion system membrane protein, PorP/SprF family n=1 Tax=Maribacter ulvicola TaxID=228959 RepID=A0A1N6ZY75_9FLAO|nr:type IX secretion system membrane protein PorP/SprF [Maribacter ulvicola]SIR31768.1 type IX secretion system membrane protein, PorP/SprF family [Maribacter ulvicola]
MDLFHKILVVLIFFSCTLTNAQQDPINTLYRYNMNLINPAYAGADGRTTIGVNVRSQWSNVQGAPETQNLIFDTTLGKNLGMGISAISDKTFIENQTSIALDFSYQVKLGENHDLFFGLKTGFNSYNANTEGLVTYGIQEDPSLMNLDDRLTPNFGAGLYLKHDNYFLSFSIPKILTRDRLEEENGVATLGADKNHFYLAGGMELPLGQNITLKPSSLLRYVEGAPISLDITTFLDFNNYFDLGAAYRVNESVSGMAIFKVSSGMMIGYAYESPFENSIRNIDNGTHEIMLNLKL